MSRRKVPYGLMFDRKSAVRPRRSSFESFLAEPRIARSAQRGAEGGKRAV